MTENQWPDAEVLMSDLVVYRVSFDPSLILSLVNTEKYELSIVTPLEITEAGPNGMTHERDMDAERNIDCESLLQALGLLNARVSRILANDEGALRVEFGDGRVITAPPQDDYEAWQLSGSDGSFVVALRGGDWASFEGGEGHRLDEGLLEG